MKKFLILILLVSVFFPIFGNNSYADITWERVFEATVSGSIWENAYSGGIDFSAPTFVDIDNDGDSDMFTGKGNGRIIYHRNDGTADSPSWTFITFSYNSIDVGENASPTFVDIDGDSDYDLFIGEYDGVINYYRNDGTAAVPSWTFVSSAYTFTDFGFVSIPAFCDIDGDNDYDMFIGESGGNINYFRNDGTSATPSWVFVTETYASIDVGPYSRPTFVDIDNDNDFDMFIGEKDGNINYYRNDGDVNTPTWTLVTETYDSIDVGEHSVPTFVDIDNDNDFDLYIGESVGNINCYRNDGTSATPSWTFITDNYELIIDVGFYSTPTFVDIDGDGDFDMFIGKFSGYISYFRNDGTVITPSWTLVTETYESIDVGSSSIPTFVDIDNDNDYDMFIGEWDGNINYYQNNGSSTNPSWTFVTATYQFIDVGGASSPEFVDIDNDGDFDMFIGEYWGKIEYYRNHGTAEKPAWTFVTSDYNSIDVGYRPTPTFVDIDNDGDFDMFIGEDSANINYYRNDGNLANPSWTFVTEFYNSIDIGASRSTISFVDINNDGDFDIFIGGYCGGLSFWEASGYTSNPLLSWTGEINYTTDGLNLEIGSDSNTFIYRIRYTSSENNAPNSVSPKVHILKGGIKISGSPFIMNEVNSGDTTYTDGKLYTYSKSGLSPGTDYTYYFEAYDFYGAPASGVPTNSVNAPDIIRPKLFADDLNNIKVYPNPYKPGMGADGIVFDNLTENAKICIYTIEGKLVITILPDSINYKWNIKNESGNKLSSGIYLYIISNDKGEKKTGKLAVVK